MAHVPEKSNGESDFPVSFRNDVCKSSVFGAESGNGIQTPAGDGLKADRSIEREMDECRFENRDFHEIL